MIAAILAGGKGLRLWPESRRNYPKQLCEFIDDKTMLDHTIDRLIKAGTEKIIIITGDDLTPVVKKIIAKRSDQELIEILSEPEGKNTAPAVGLVLSKYYREKSDEIIGIFPADHHVLDNEAFSLSINQAADAARQGYLATIGIKPKRPETGFGYIEKTKWEVGQLNNVYQVHSFFEKPALSTAQTFIASGQHMWNAGIYIGQISTFLQEFAAYLPEIYHKIYQGYNEYILSYAQMPNISLDYGIAEKSQRMVVVPADFGWSDLGSWNALAELHQNDSRGNVLIGSNVIVKDSQQCIVKQKNKSIVLFGVNDLLVVETDEIIFVSERKNAQEIKDLVEFLQQKQRYDLL